MLISVCACGVLFNVHAKALNALSRVNVHGFKKQQAQAVDGTKSCLERHLFLLSVSSIDDPQTVQ